VIGGTPAAVGAPAVIGERADLVIDRLRPSPETDGPFRRQGARPALEKLSVLVTFTG